MHGGCSVERGSELPSADAAIGWPVLSLAIRASQRIKKVKNGYGLNMPCCHCLATTMPSYSLYQSVSSVNRWWAKCVLMSKSRTGPLLLLHPRVHQSEPNAA